MKLAHVSSGNGTPVVILHGLFGSARNWAAIARRLAETRRVHCLDARNHGESPWDDEMTYAAMAGDVAEFLRGEAIESPVVIGHSMGGKTAMTLALDGNVALAGLVVVDIAPVPYRIRFMDEVEAMRSLDLAALVRRTDADAAIADSVPDAGVRAFLLHNLASTEDGGYRWRVNLAAIAANAEALAGFDPPAGATYGGPALFLRGGESAYVRDKHHAEIRRLFPAAAIETVPGAGHWLHAEAPDAVLAHITALLDAAEAR